MATRIKLLNSLCLWPSEVSSLFNMAWVMGFRSLDVKLEMTGMAAGAIAISFSGFLVVISTNLFLLFSLEVVGGNICSSPQFY